MLNASNTGLVRVYYEGTAFFVTDINPFDLMAQRGNEVKALGKIDDLCESEIDLRRAVKRSELAEKTYLDILFDTPADEIPWYHQQAA